MNLSRFFLMMAATQAIFASCKKDINIVSSIASLTVINASTDNPSIVGMISDTIVPFYLNLAPISYQSFAEYGYPAGNVPLILVSAADTTQVLFQGKFNLQAGGTYSFYVVGKFKALDTLFMQDKIINYSDSLAGVRFINLLPGSRSVSINLQSNLPTQTEFANLSYKQITPFETYPDTSCITSYNFEVRDQTSGNLLTTFSWNFTVHKNNTLVISGSENPASPVPINVFQVNNF
jgi:hypothetical protein